jgi:hypothetical protein
MLYNQPYGKPPEVTWGDTPYINGNPSTGVAGSIPPAASIEYPQREIVNFINDCGFTATNADLSQLAKSVQSSKVIWGVDGGTANAYQITVSPVPNVLTPGMMFLVQISNPNTGPSVLNVNAMGPHPIVHHDKSPISNGELVAGALELFAFDGSNFELAWSSRAVGGGGPIFLTANTDYYVDPSGNDSWDGLSAAHSTGIHGPFLTLQQAANQIPLYNLNGYSVNIHVANGPYAPVSFQRINGVGTVHWIGNPGSPGNCLITAVNSSAVRVFDVGGTYTFDGFRMTASGAAPGSSISNIDVVGASTTLILGSVDFLTAGGGHISISQGALVSNNFPCTWTILGGLVGSPSADGSVIFTYSGGRFIQNSGGGPSLSVNGGYSITGSFATANFNAFIQIQFASIAGTLLSGKKFAVDQNSEISTAGAGINYFPATAAGTQGAHGGYYS